MVTYPFKAFIYKENIFVDVSYVSLMKNYFIEYHRREDIEKKRNMKEGALMSNTFVKDSNNKLIYVKDYVKYNDKTYLVDVVKNDNGGIYFLFDSKKEPYIPLAKAKKLGKIEVVGNYYLKKKEEPKA